MKDKWKEYKVGDVAEIVGGGTPSTKEEDNFGGTIPWLTPKDLSGYPYRYISHGERNITEKGLSNSSAKLLPAKSVLLTTRAPVGYVAIAKNPVTTNQGFRNLVLRDGFDPVFVYYLLKKNTEFLKNHSSGTTFGELSGSTLKSLTFLFPPLSEQKAIAHILGALDDKIELNRKMNETLEAMARAIFKPWFVAFDPVCAKAEGRDPGLLKEIADLFPDGFEDSEMGEIPKGWRVGNVSDIADVSSGERPELRQNFATADCSIPLYGGGGQMGFVSTPLYKEPILFTGRVGTLGQIHRIVSASWPSDNTLVIRPYNENMFEYLYFSLKNIDFDSLNRGSTQPLVTQSDLKKQIIAIPPDYIFQRYHDVAYSLFLHIDANNEQSHTLAAIRRALLPKLLSGEIRVKDAERFVEDKL